MSRIPVQPPAEVDDRPTIAGSTLAFSVALAFALLGGALFLPWTIGRWLRAIRATTTKRTTPGRTMTSGLAFLVVIGAPMIDVLAATMSAQREGDIEAANVIGPVGLTLLLVPLFARLPLMLTDSDAVSVREAAARSIAHAIADPVTTVRLTVVLVGALAFGQGVALQIAQQTNDLAVVVGTLTLLPVVLGVWVFLLSRQTHTEPPRVRVWMLGVLACVFGLPFLLIVLAGGLATSERRDVTVVRDGRGHQPVRGLMLEQGPRGSLRAERFTIVGAHDGIVVEPLEGARYEVVTRYPSDAARFDEEPCSGWHARMEPDCRRIAMRGPDWEMELLVDRAGARLDDGEIDRALERVGVAGIAAVVLALLILVIMAVRVARIVRMARRLAGRDRALRLEGVLELGPGGRVERGERIVGHDNRVTLREGGVVLRLPEGFRALGVARAAIDTKEVRLDARVACDRVPGIVTHRSAEAAWPTEASLVVGEPDVIESESIGDAERSLSAFVLVGSAIGTVALVALSIA